jgi:hypothetical protein
MIRGFFDEVLVAERQFSTSADLSAGLTPGGGAIDNKAYRQLRFTELELGTAETTSDEHVQKLDVVRGCHAHATTSACPAANVVGLLRGSEVDV